VSHHTAKAYFEILCDTLLGRWLPAFRKRPKRRTTTSPKFYFHDVGVVNTLAKRRGVERGSELYGKALENLVHHELAAYISYQRLDVGLCYWRLTTGVEVNFIVGDRDVAIECKSATAIRSHHLKNLRELAKEHPRVKARIVVCHDPLRRRTEDGIEILSFEAFVDALGDGDIVSSPSQ
jgi:predicted AAA+ superfamily ATPase